MKKITALFVLAIFALSIGTAQARNNAGETTVVGAAGGALMGQVIGRNTESMLVGAAVGGVIGYLVGNEMDRDGHVRRVHHAPSPAYAYYAPPPARRPVKVVVVKESRYKNAPKQWRCNNRVEYRDHGSKGHWQAPRHSSRHYGARGSDHYRSNW